MPHRNIFRSETLVKDLLLQSIRLIFNLLIGAYLTEIKRSEERNPLVANRRLYPSDEESETDI